MATGDRRPTQQKTTISADGQTASAVEEVGVQRFDAESGPSSIYARSTARGGVRRI
ncbi:hypothetical protein M378DRAFT_165069 [Amanita muscaria Koide BX008]|uniref:Uncharacterized protein n=1 Tax=Amanita muscaria (strain Koide BX008) TaxID=946122 RepID=A0A0C2X2Q0_AMAMK|nr:hypothetical protein M378DRAFT_165069 [Amanita muscaria Koide BX008]